MLAVLAAESGHKQVLSRGGENRHFVYLRQNDSTMSLNSANECVGPCTSTKPAIGDDAGGDGDPEIEKEEADDGDLDRTGPEFAILFLFVMLFIGCSTRLALEYINSTYGIRIPYSVMLVIIGVLIGAMTWKVSLVADGKVRLRKFAVGKYTTETEILKRRYLHSPPNNSRFQS